MSRINSLFCAMILLQGIWNSASLVAQQTTLSAASESKDADETRVAPSSLTEAIAVLESELADQQIALGQNHPRILALKNQLEALRKAADPAETELPPAGKKLALIIVPIRYSEAKTIERLLQQVYGERAQKILADERANSLLLYADEETRKEILQVLNELDVPNAIRTDDRLTKSDANPAPGSVQESVEDLQKNASRLERRSQELATQLRGALPHPGPADELKAELRSTVQQAFEARQKLQRAELVQFSRRLQGIRQSIETRDRIAKQIIDRRVQELLDPNLRWESSQVPDGAPDVRTNSAYRGSMSYRDPGGDPATSDNERLVKIVPDERLFWQLFGAKFREQSDLRSGNKFTRGLEIVELRPGGPAAAIGLRLGDIVIAIDGMGTESLSDLNENWQVTAAKRSVEVMCLRGVQTLEVNLEWSTIPRAQLGSVLSRSINQTVEISLGTSDGIVVGDRLPVITHQIINHDVTVSGQGSVEIIQVKPDRSIARITEESNGITITKGSLVSPQPVGAETFRDSVPAPGGTVTPSSNTLAEKGITVTVPLDSETHTSETLRQNVGRYEVSLLASGVEGRTEDGIVKKFTINLAVNCRLQSISENVRRDGSRWEAKLFVPQGSEADGQNQNLTQKSIDSMVAKGATFRLDHLQEPVDSPSDGDATALSTTHSAEPVTITEPSVDPSSERLVLRNVQTEIAFTIPGQNKQVFYWRGIPVDGTNKVVVARENFRPGTDKETMSRDFDTFCQSIDFITVMSVDRGVGEIAIPGTIAGFNHELGLLLIEVDAQYVFASASLAEKLPAKGQRLQVEYDDQRMQVEVANPWTFPTGIVGVRIAGSKPLAKSAEPAPIGATVLDSRNEIVGIVVSHDADSKTGALMIPSAAISNWLNSSDSLGHQTAMQFETPQALLDYMGTMDGVEDLSYLMNCVTEEESKTFAGMLLQQATMFSTLSAFAAAIPQEDSATQASAMKAMVSLGTLLKTSMRPDPPADAAIAYQQLVQANMKIFTSGGNSPAAFTPDVYLHLIRTATGVLKDHREFVVEMSKAMAKMEHSPDAKKNDPSNKPVWKIDIEGDHAVATDTREQKADSGKSISSSTMELTRVNGSWKISKMLDDDTIKQLAAGPQVSHSSDETKSKEKKK